MERNKKSRIKFEIFTRHESGPFDRKKNEDTEEFSLDPIEAVCHAMHQKGDCRIRVIWKDEETGEKQIREFGANPRGHMEWKKIIEDRERLNKERSESPAEPKPAPIPDWPWINIAGMRDWHGVLEFAQERGLLDASLTDADLVAAEMSIASEHYEQGDFVEEAPAPKHDPRRAPSLTGAGGGEEKTDGKDEG